MTKNLKITTTFILLTFVATITYAQKGTKHESIKFYAGLNFFAAGKLSDEKTTIDVRSSNTKENGGSYVIIPNAGIILNHGFLIGAGVGLQGSKTNETVSANNSDYSEKEKLNFARIYLIKEFKLTDKTKLFVQANFDYTKEQKEKTTNSPPGTFGYYSHKAYYFNPSFFPGIKTKLASNIDAELTYGVISYAIGDLTFESDSKYELTRKTINFNPNTITLGLKYQF